MSCTTRPQPLSHTPKQVSVDLDEMDPIAWNIDPSPEDLALLNVVELEQDDIAHLVENESITTTTTAAEDTLKRCRDEGKEDGGDPEERKTPPHGQQQLDQHGQILPAVSRDNQDLINRNINTNTPVCPEGPLVTIEESPRVSRRPKKKCKGNTTNRSSSSCSLPKRPLGAYGIFYHQERQRIVESLTEGSLSEDDIQRQVGKLWRALPEEGIKKFEQLAEQEKTRYHQEMAALHSPTASSDDSNNLKLESPPKNDLRGLEDERGYFAYDFPPPPPGVTVIPANGSGASEAGSSVVGTTTTAAAAAAAGMKVATPTSSPVPPPTPPRFWGGGYGCHPTPIHRPAYPSPVPSAVTSAGPPPHVVQSSPYPPPRREYYPPPSPRPSWVVTAAPGAAPPSPYHHQRPPVVPPAPAVTRYSPDFARTARPAPAYAAPPPPPRPHYYSIPPGMELALPDMHGREKKYRVTYKCYRMRSEDVQGFLDSMSQHGQPLPQHHYHHHPHPHPPQQHHHQQHPQAQAQAQAQPQPQPAHQPSYGHGW